MTAAVLQERSASGGAGTSMSLAFTNPVVPGSAFHNVGVGKFASTTWSCSDNVNGAHQFIAKVEDGSIHSVGHFYLNGTAAGTPTVTIASSVSEGSLSIGIREIGQGVYDTHAEQLANSPGTAADAFTSGNATPSVQPGLISGISVYSTGAPVFSAGTGFTAGALLWGGGAADLWESKRYTSLAATAATFTSSTNSNAFILAALFKEASLVIAPQTQLTGQATGGATTHTYAGSVATTAGWFGAVYLTSDQVVTAVTDNNGHNATAILLLGTTAVNKLYLAYFENIPALAAWKPVVTTAVSANVAMCGGLFSGVAAFNSLDRTAFATGNGTALSSGATASTRSPNQLVLGFGEVDNAQPITWTQGSGFTLSSHVDTAATTQVGMFEYMAVAVPGVQTAVATWTASDSPKNWGFCCATFSSTPLTPAPVIVQNVPITSAVGADATGTINSVAAGNTLAVAVAVWCNSSGGLNTAPTVTDTTLGLSLTAAVAPAGTANGGAGTNLSASIFYLPAGSVTPGTHVIKVHSTSGNITHIDAAIIEISGLPASAPVDQSNSAVGATAQALAVATTTTQPVDLAIAVLAQRAGVGVANANFACPGYTDLMTDSVTTDGLGASIRSQVVNAVGAPSASYRWADPGTVASQAAIATFKSGAGGGGSIGGRLMLLGVGS